MHPLDENAIVIEYQKTFKIIILQKNRTIKNYKAKHCNVATNSIIIYQRKGRHEVEKVQDPSTAIEVLLFRH